MLFYYQEVELMPKERRKEVFRIRKLKLDAEQEEREKVFLEQLSTSQELCLQRLQDSHHERQALADRQFLQQKQQVIVKFYSERKYLSFINIVL